MLEPSVSEYLDRFRGRPQAASRLSEATRLLERLAVHLADVGIEDWREVNSRVLTGFVALEVRGHNRRGQPIAAYTLRHRIWLLRDFFCWLENNGRVLPHLRANLVLPKIPGRLPRVPTEAEMARLLAAPDTMSAVGLRDRAILELLYATGLRRKEVWRLELYDLDLEGRRLAVRQGKGGQDRVVPLTITACRWLALYLDQARSELARRARSPDASDLALWLSFRGGRLSYVQIAVRVRQYAKAAKVRASSHACRHACATHLVRHGADVRQVQLLLGHRCLETTEIYTEVEVADLARVMEAAFARAHKRRSKTLRKPR